MIYTAIGKSVTNQIKTVFQKLRHQIQKKNKHVPHCSSSDPSAQSGTPLHRSVGERHCPFVHLNWSGCLHDTKAKIMIIYSILY